MSVFRIAFLIISSLLLLTSCSKDESDTSFDGIWIKHSFEKRGCNDSEENSERDGLFVYDIPCNTEPRFICSYERIEFSGSTYSRNSSSTFIGIPLSFSDEGTYTISGKTLTMCRNRSSGEKDCTVMEYAISGNTLKIQIKDPQTGCLDIDYYKK